MTGRWPSRRFAPFLASPSTAGVFVDFDGTIADIVMDPARAVPRAGAAQLLEDLAGSVGRVGILSGRPLAFLESFFGDEIALAGLYGLETRIDGQRRDHPQAGAWREVVDDVVACASQKGPEGMRVESKGLSITLHYREHPEAEAKVDRFAAQQAARSGLECRRARMSVELHPPIRADKGTALLSLAEDLESVCYFGDDVGDLPAFDALDQLATDGVHTVRVVARSEESSPAMLERADVIVDGPDGVMSLLGKFVTRVVAPAG
ncbi:MAG: trehalose-phosphatase [Acidimicrobiia bacterium]|nr:trehalose-phosphatase [Acidimicrobiia bacterium]